MKASPKIRSAVLAVLKQYWKAYEEQDAKAILDITVPDEDAVFLGAGEDEIVYGPKELKKALKRDFSQALSSKVTMKKVSVFAAGDAAWLYGDCRLKAATTEGSVVVAGRFTAVFEKRGESWLMAQSHFSVPDVGQAPGESFPKKKCGRK